MGVEMEQESTMKKIVKMICAMIPLVLSVVLGIGYSTLSSRAGAFNEAAVSQGFATVNGVPAYDDCKVPLGYTLMSSEGGMLGEYGDLLNEITENVTDITDDAIDQVDEQLENLDEKLNDEETDNADADADADTDVDADVDESILDDIDLDLDLDLTNEDANEAAENLNDLIDNGLDFFNDFSGLDIAAPEGTSWTMIYNFNFIFFIILAVQSLLLTISAFAIKLRKIVACCCCCTNIVHIVMVIMALAARYDDAGDMCAMNTTAYDTEGNNFAADADTFGTLSVLAIATYVLFCCAPCCVASTKQVASQ